MEPGDRILKSSTVCASFERFKIRLPGGIYGDSFLPRIAATEVKKLEYSVELLHSLPGFRLNRKRQGV